GVDQRSADPAAPFIVKLDAGGRYAWTRVFPASDGADIAALVTAAGDGVLAVGTYSGTMTFADSPGVTLPASLSSAPFAVRLAASGAPLWAWSVDPSTDGIPGTGASASPTADGGFLVTGLFGGTVDFAPGARVVARAAPSGTSFAVKLTGAGALVWVNAYLTGGPSCLLSLIGGGGATFAFDWVAGNLSGACDLDPGPGVVMRQ